MKDQKKVLIWSIFTFLTTALQHSYLITASTFHILILGQRSSALRHKNGQFVQRKLRRAKKPRNLMVNVFWRYSKSVYVTLIVCVDTKLTKLPINSFILAQKSSIKASSILRPIAESSDPENVKTFSKPCQLTLCPNSKIRRF